MNVKDCFNMLIDIGVNLSNKRFADDMEDVLDSACASGVSKMILTGTSLEESEAVITLCKKYADKYPGMLYATTGIHPHDAKSFTPSSIGALRDLAKQPEVVAIGETGLDFNRNFSTPSDQEKTFEAQLELAAELQLPVFMHERDASTRQRDILYQYRDHLVDAVIHCFTGDKKGLFDYLDLNLHIGITGWVCDERRGLPLQKLIRNIPLDRLMIETDAPYLVPRNMPDPPKNKRNQPAFLPWVLKGITVVREETEEQIALATTRNANRFFRLP